MLRSVYIPHPAAMLLGIELYIWDTIYNKPCILYICEKIPTRKLVGISVMMLTNNRIMQHRFFFGISLRFPYFKNFGIKIGMLGWFWWGLKKKKEKFHGNGNESINTRHSSLSGDGVGGARKNITCCVIINDFSIFIVQFYHIYKCFIKKACWHRAMICRFTFLRCRILNPVKSS